jgi:hypothetical protein
MRFYVTSVGDSIVVQINLEYYGIWIRGLKVDGIAYALFRIALRHHSCK